MFELGPKGKAAREESKKKSKEEFDKVFDRVFDELDENARLLFKKIFLISLLGGVCGGATIMVIALIVFN